MSSSAHLQPVEAPSTRPDLQLHQPDPATRPRLHALDAARGLAVVTMVVGHASMFAKVNIRAAQYAGRHLPLPAPGWTAVGMPMYLAPALFWFLLGTSVALLDGRRSDARAVDRFLLVRAAILVVLDQTLISYLWTPAHAWHFVPVVELCTALGFTLALLVPLRRWSDAGLGALAATLAFGYPLVVHALGQAGLEALPLPLRILFAYDFTHVPMITFPLLGWLPVPLLGLLVGRRLARPAWQGPRPWLLLAAALGAIGLASRVTGYGDYTPWAPGDGLQRWFVLSNGPPGLDFMALYLAAGCLALAALSAARLSWRAPWARWLVTLGRTTLFAFAAHLAICFVVARVLLHVLRHADALRYALTSAGVLVLLSVACTAYARLRARYPRSVLRYV